MVTCLSGSFLTMFERLSDYRYDLPPELIAQHPADRRDASRLLVVNRSDNSLMHSSFAQLGDFLQSGDLLVLNDTRVVPARIYGHKPTGGAVEVVLSKKLADGQWEAVVGAKGRAKPGMRVLFDGFDTQAEVLKSLGEGVYLLRFEGPQTPEEIMEKIGHMPLPPYIKRASDIPTAPEDRARYQTVFARSNGAAAAPTAGLHFTPELLNDLARQGIDHTFVTLHVGPGTFLPIREEDLTLVHLHSEKAFYPQSALEAVAKLRERSGRLVAVGTTSVRTLESLPDLEHTWSGDTSLFIRPGYKFKHIDAMITNFHLPESSLLMLVAAFAGKELMDAAYSEAIEKRYRFYSYGDAMLIL